MEVFPKSSYHWTYLQNSLSKEVMGDYGHTLPKTQGKKDGRRRSVIRYSAANCEDARWGLRSSIDDYAPMEGLTRKWVENFAQ
jgi:hypothetical protein